MQWTKSLSCPVLSAEVDRDHLPEEILKAEAPDGDLYALLWGQGSQTEPYRITIVFVPPVPEGSDPPDSRFPTIEECHEAASHLLPRGALYALSPPLVTQDVDDIPQVRGSVALSWAQIGVAEGSAAARHSQIIRPTPGGILHA